MSDERAEPSCSCWYNVETGYLEWCQGCMDNNRTHLPNTPHCYNQHTMEETAQRLRDERTAPRANLGLDSRDVQHVQRLVKAAKLAYKRMVDDGYHDDSCIELGEALGPWRT